MSSLLSKEDCEKIIYKHEKTKVTVLEYFVQKASDKVLGYLAEHYELKINYVKEGIKSIQEKTFFVKAVPLNNDKQMKYVEEMGVFKKEILIYRNLLAQLLAISSKPFAPQFFYANADKCLVLQDLKVENFRISESNLYTIEQCKLVLETVARFHASSVIFEEQHSTEQKPFRIGDEYPAEVTEVTYSFTPGQPRNKWLITTTKCLEDLAEIVTRNRLVSERLHNYVFQKVPELLKPSKQFRNVMSHDDLWNNNIMFNSCNECLLVDFQMTRYSPPIFDVLLMIYMNMTQASVENYLTELLDHYYDCFLAELNIHGLNSKVFPKYQFLESVKDYNTVALIESVMYGTNVFLPEHVSELVVSNQNNFEEFAFVNRGKYILDEYKTNEVFRNRMNQVLIPLVKIFENMPV